MTATARRGKGLTRARPAGLRGALRALYRLVSSSPAAPLLRLPAIQRAHRRLTATSVSAADVVEILHTLDAEGVDAWLAGGWACDALLGGQTRQHADLDLLIAEDDRARACELLEQHDFSLYLTFTTGLMRIAVELLDRRRRRKVALHPVDLGDGPDSWQASVRDRMRTLGLDTREVLAYGTVAGHELGSVSAPALLALHTGYQPTATDRHDVQLICTRFSLPAPPGYRWDHAR